MRGESIVAFFYMIYYVHTKPHAHTHLRDTSKQSEENAQDHFRNGQCFCEDTIFLSPV